MKQASVFIARADAMHDKTRVHVNWVLHAWACTGACEAQNPLQMQAEMNVRWFGRVV